MSMFRKDLLSGKRILITGGGTGLGKEFADEYMSLGAEVHICGRRGSVLDEAAAELIEKNSGTIRTHVCDVRDAAAVLSSYVDALAIRPAPKGQSWDVDRRDDSIRRASWPTTSATGTAGCR